MYTTKDKNRSMSNKMIVKCFDSMFEDEEFELMFELMVDFVRKYPLFTQTYIDILTKKISFVNRIISDIRSNE